MAVLKSGSTIGASPMAGIDIEPNFSYSPVDDIIIENCIFRDNYSGGLLFLLY